MMSGASLADARQQLGLIGIASRERVRGNRIADDLPERMKGRCERSLPDGLQ